MNEVKMKECKAKSTSKGKERKIEICEQKRQIKHFQHERTMSKWRETLNNGISKSRRELRRQKQKRKDTEKKGVNDKKKKKKEERILQKRRQEWTRKKNGWVKRKSENRFLLEIENKTKKSYSCSVLKTSCVFKVMVKP